MRVGATVLGLVFVVVSGCAGSTTARSAKPYALLLPTGEPAPDPLPDNTSSIATEPLPRTPSLQSVEQRLARARRLYRDLAFRASLDELGEAQREAEARLQAREATELLDRIFLLRALDYLALGDRDEARLALRQAAVLRPDREVLDPAEFAPDVRVEYQEVRQSLQTEAPVAFRVESEPTASLSSDGRQVGSTPLLLSLHRGRHYLVFRAPRCATEFRTVDVDAESALTLRIELDALRPAQIAGELAGLDALEFAALESTARMGFMSPNGSSPVHVGSESGGWRAALIDPVTGNIVRTASTATPRLEPAVAELVQSLRDVPQPKPLVRKWWFWTVIGVALVGTSLALYFGLRKQPEPQLVIIPARS